jgi:hypothetical protein
MQSNIHAKEKARSFWVFIATCFLTCGPPYPVTPSEQGREEVVDRVVTPPMGLRGLREEAAGPCSVWQSQDVATPITSRLPIDHMTRL